MRLLNAYAKLGSQEFSVESLRNEASRLDYQGLLEFLGECVMSMQG
jgi:hypothetical protein